MVRERYYISNFCSNQKEYGYNTYEVDENGFKCSEETKEKIRNTKRCIEVDLYTIEGVFIDTYRSISLCSRSININSRSIMSIS